MESYDKVMALVDELGREMSHEDYKGFLQDLESDLATRISLLEEDSDWKNEYFTI